MAKSTQSQVTERTNKQTTKGARGEFGFPMTSLRQEMDQLFDKFFTASPYSLIAGTPLSSYLRPDTPEYAMSLMPTIDIEDTDNALILTAELPGIKEKDIELKIDDGTLVLKGEKRCVTHSKDEAWAINERRFGEFERRVRLPEAVNVDKIKAEYDCGVLTVTIPKRSDAKHKVKRIQIR